MSGILEPLLPYTPYLALLVRVWVGTNFILHANLKLPKKGREQAAQWMKSMGLPAVAASLATTLELVGGIFLILGLIVPVVALLFVIEMISTSALNKLKMKKGYIGGYELDVLYILLDIVLFVLGGGALSIDSVIGL
ncbi:MAG: DoxX family protein [Thaumarchaeota archaeon]|nr:MAG: DoxX family protein [Nitrososphaerota archaeon]